MKPGDKITRALDTEKRKVVCSLDERYGLEKGKIYTVASTVERESVNLKTGAVVVDIWIELEETKKVAGHEHPFLSSYWIPK